MANPPKHPVEQPVFRSLMLTSLFLGVVLLVCAAQPGAGSRFLSIIAMLFFAIFVVSFGLYWLAWVLREHELWREGRQGEEE
ncbi:hypothetical protein [Micromonospora sp. U21]|uniref:hypothetical protein n=1 Tax=Micromonospora sp. U21 TaxID=2824899 RepID=UPI001B390AD2|nr:hypothetical protein [Micromonospora sp. U21]MBQ0904946.1 hypothetical protein [Micromonospora sp. U21]